MAYAAASTAFSARSRCSALGLVAARILAETNAGGLRNAAEDFSPKLLS